MPNVDVRRLAAGDRLNRVNAEREVVTGPQVPGWLLSMPPRRTAGRVLLLDGVGRALLAQGSSQIGGPPYLYLVGGGAEGEESPAEAAVREVREETGYVFDPASLVGPLDRREVVYDFRQIDPVYLWTVDEHHFVARISDAAARVEINLQPTEAAYGAETHLYTRAEVRDFRNTRTVVEPGWFPPTLFDLWDAAEAALAERL